VKSTIREVCDRLLDLIDGRRASPHHRPPDILYGLAVQLHDRRQKATPIAGWCWRRGLHESDQPDLQAANGRSHYSVIRGSPYDDDLFPVSETHRSVPVRRGRSAPGSGAAPIWPRAATAIGEQPALDPAERIADGVVAGLTPARNLSRSAVSPPAARPPALHDRPARSWPRAATANWDSLH